MGGGGGCALLDTVLWRPLLRQVGGRLRVIVLAGSGLLRPESSQLQYYEADRDWSSTI